MSEQPPSVPPAPPVPPAPIVRRGRGMSPVWIIPIVAALVGLWLVWQHYSGMGPLVEVRFETAEGVDAGKTAVQCRSVKIGMVETVRLAGNQKGVIAMLRIDHDAADLLKTDTRF